MIKDYILPSPNLREYIDRYWFWECDKKEDVQLPDIYPASGTEMIFHYRNPFQGFPQSHIVCPRSKSNYTLKQAGSIGFISVRFKCWSFTHFSNIPIEYIKDKSLDVSTLWPKLGSAIEEKIIDAGSITDKADVLNSFFESILLRGKIQSPEIDWAVNYIYYNFNKVSINNIIEDCNLSKRTFQRKFKQAVGVSAKSFQKIARFEKTLKHSLLSGKYPNLDKLLSTGYYDQAHFNKDFKYFTEKNPTEIITSNNNMAHFYNTSIK